MPSQAAINDPLVNDFLEIEGVSGFVEVAQQRTFQLDYSGYVQLIKTSYDCLMPLDLKKHIPLSAYTYYCVIALWKRLLDVVSVREESSEQIQLREAFNSIEYPLLTDIHLYLSGIGDIRDPLGRQFHLQIQSLITDDTFDTIGGTFGEINADTHILYETLPAPGIAVLKMMADLAPTSAPLDWDLPAGLRPDDASATMPNENLLCWRKRDRLTNMQRRILEEGGMKYEDPGIKYEDPPACINHIANVPICDRVLSKISTQLKQSRCKYMKFPSSPQGSQAQVAFISRSRDDCKVEAYKNIAAKSGRTNSYTQASSHVASGAAIFRYRIQRRTYEEIDCVGYRFQGNAIPQSWLDNCNQVFDHGLAQQLWNSSQFRLSEMDGIPNLMTFSKRTKKTVAKD